MLYISTFIYIFLSKIIKTVLFYTICMFNRNDFLFYFYKIYLKIFIKNNFENIKIFKKTLKTL